jgi:hypothetical protein
VRITGLAGLGVVTGMMLGAPVVNARPVPEARASGTEDPTDLQEAVRNATRRFADVGAAVAAGYAPFLGCVNGPDHGAMGIHYVNGDYVGDGQIDVEKPEALLYEMRDGQLQLLGVEYLVTVDAWHAHNPAHAPALFGQVFNFSGSPNRFGLPPFYELHVWAWRQNPDGAYVDWNREVSCEGMSMNP